MSYFTNQIDEHVTELLQSGAVGLLPTDTIYGLSTLASNPSGVGRIHLLKDRSEHKPFIVLISDIDQLELLGIDPNQADPIKKYWPAPLSVIFDSPAVSTWLQLRTASLAVRLPDHDYLRNLIRKVGPIISTSANLQGQQPASSVKEAQDVFGTQLDFYVDAGELVNEASTLVKITDGLLQVVRQGVVKI